MVPNAKPVQAERIELPSFAARAAQRVPECLRQIERADRVHHHAYGRAALLRRCQRRQEPHRERARRTRVDFQADRHPGGFNRLQHCRKDFPPGTQPTAACRSDRPQHD